MATKTFFLLKLVLTFTFASCNKMTPAGFWKYYSNDLLVKNISDQGPYGGHTAVHWKSNKTNAFSSTNILDFAKKNGWTLVDSSDFNDDHVNKWTYNNKAVFPLTSSGFSETHLNDPHLTDFPRWFEGQVTVYKFKTGWVTIEPDTDNSIEENGFVVINNDGTEMAVYHLWGE
jgi:hypothetical protein